MNPESNKIAPDVTLFDLGQLVLLSQMWMGGQNALLVFLRHLG